MENISHEYTQIIRSSWYSNHHLSCDNSLTLQALDPILLYNYTFIFLHIETNHFNPNTFTGEVGKVRKKEEGRVEKKACAMHPRGPGIEPTRDLLRARRGFPAARHGSRSDKRTFPWL